MLPSWLPEADERFCEEHAKQEASRYERYDRDPATHKRYGRAWKCIRDRYITAHPLCKQCRKYGWLTPAEEVHHIKPLSQSRTNDCANLMALCKACHSEITAREGGRWGRQGVSKSLQLFHRTTGVGFHAKKRGFKPVYSPGEMKLRS